MLWNYHEYSLKLQKKYYFLEDVEKFHSCFLEMAEQFHACFLEGAEQFHSCFLEGAEQFHWRNSSTSGIVPLLLFKFTSIWRICAILSYHLHERSKSTSRFDCYSHWKRILATLALININGGTVPLLLTERMAEQFHFCF